VRDEKTTRATKNGSAKAVRSVNTVSASTPYASFAKTLRAEKNRAARHDAKVDQLVRETNWRFEPIPSPSSRYSAWRDGITRKVKARAGKSVVKFHPLCLYSRIRAAGALQRVS
jgi:hypothetical protein